MTNSTNEQLNEQQRIEQVQAIYQEWLALQPKIQQAQADWQKNVELMAKLEEFYFDGEFLAIFDKMEDGLTLDLTTQGEDSVMGEDTIWDAVDEQQQALWWMMRFAVKHLDKQHHGENEE